MARKQPPAPYYIDVYVCVRICTDVCQSMNICVSHTLSIQERVLKSLGVGITGVNKIADVDAGT